MGLDAIEIQMEIEETFGIEWTDDDYLAVSKDNDITVGAMYERILEKAGLHDDARNNLRLNFQLWKQTQIALHQITAWPLDKVELSTPLEDLFPTDRRRDLWDDFQQAYEYRIPELDYPLKVRFVAISLAAVPFLVEQVHIFLVPGFEIIKGVCILLGLWLFSETYLKMLPLLAGYRTAIPHNVLTVKELCHWILGANFRELCHDNEIPLAPKCMAVWELLTQVFVNSLEVEESDVTYQTRLFDDLGAG